MILEQTNFNFKVLTIQEESEKDDVMPSDSFFAQQSMLAFRRPINVVRKLVSTQRRSSLQRLSSSITNLAEVCGKASRGVHSQITITTNHTVKVPIRYLLFLIQRKTIRITSLWFETNISYITCIERWMSIKRFLRHSSIYFYNLLMFNLKVIFLIKM